MTQDSSSPVEIEMFVDVSCPWCHGALETNRRLLDELTADPAVPTIAPRWRFMRLHPMPGDGSPTTLADMYAGWAPDAPGAYVLELDLVREFEGWFEDFGGAPFPVRLTVGAG